MSVIPIVLFVIPAQAGIQKLNSDIKRIDRAVKLNDAAHST